MLIYFSVVLMKAYSMFNSHSSLFSGFGAFWPILCCYLKTHQNENKLLSLGVLSNALKETGLKLAWQAELRLQALWSNYLVALFLRKRKLPSFFRDQDKCVWHSGLTCMARMLTPWMFTWPLEVNLQPVVMLSGPDHLTRVTSGDRQL